MNPAVRGRYIYRAKQIHFLQWATKSSSVYFRAKIDEAFDNSEEYFYRFVAIELKLDSNTVIGSTKCSCDDEDGKFSLETSSLDTLLHC